MRLLYRFGIPLGAVLLLALPIASDRIVLVSLAQSVPPVGWLFGVAVGVGYGSERWLVGRFGELATLTMLVAVIAVVGRATSIAAEPPAGVPSMKVATWNTEFWDQDKDLEVFGDQLAGLEADILLLQEHIHWDDEAERIVPIQRADVLGDCCGYEHIEVHGELVVASRFPIRPISTENDYVQIVDVVTPEGPVRVANIHLPVHVTMLASPLSGDFYDYTRDALADRSAAVGVAERQLDTDRSELILGGDFNATVLSPSLRGLLSQLDAGLLNLGPGTFPASSPLWQLDHLVTSSGLARDCSVVALDQPISDHRPITCDLYGGRQ